MKNSIDERVYELANYIAENNATVREAASRFGVSKSTVHKDVTQRLYEIDRSLYSRVQVVLARNKAERHLRGGMATKQKYAALSRKGKAPVIKITK